MFKNPEGPSLPPLGGTAAMSASAFEELSECGMVKTSSGCSLKELREVVTPDLCVGVPPSVVITWCQSVHCWKNN